MNTLQSKLNPLEPDHPFANQEKLFHAVREIHVQNGRTVLPDAIRLPSISCNREKYRSFPEAVLAAVSGKPQLGYLYVACLLAGDIPPPETADEHVFWEFFVEHDPCEDNYSHSEVRARRRGKQYDPCARPSSSALKLRLKVSLAGKMRIVPRYAPST